MTSTAAASTVWCDGDYGLTPADYAAFYTRAAALIGQLGYNPHGENYEHERGISIETAIVSAVSLVGFGKIARTADVAEEAVTRLVGVAYLLGIMKRRTHIDDLSNRLAAWELHHDSYSGTDASEQTARELLTTAAAIMGGIQ